MATVSYQPSNIWNKVPTNVSSSSSNDIISNNHTVSNVSILLDSLLKDYDNSLRPDFGGESYFFQKFFIHSL